MMEPAVEFVVNVVHHIGEQKPVEEVARAIPVEQQAVCIEFEGQNCHKSSGEMEARVVQTTTNCLWDGSVDILLIGQLMGRKNERIYRTYLFTR